VDAFIHYARQFKSMAALVAEVDRLVATAPVRTKLTDDVVVLTTIHRAKGREWKVVFVPGCSDVVLPDSRAESVDEIEEERRLLYVAITRAKEELHIFHPRRERISRFLEQGRYDQLLPRVHRLDAIVARRPQDWRLPDDVPEFLSLCRDFRLHSYIDKWWQNHDKLGRDTVGRLACHVVGYIHAAAEPDVLNPFSVLPHEQELWKRLLPSGMQPTLIQLPKRQPPPVPVPAVPPRVTPAPHRADPVAPAPRSVLPAPKLVPPAPRLVPPAPRPVAIQIPERPAIPSPKPANSPRPSLPPPADCPYRPGIAVDHADFGKGTVRRVDVANGRVYVRVEFADALRLLTGGDPRLRIAR
jgi:hypothetical protein